VKTKNSGLHLINLPPVAYAFGGKRPLGHVTAHVGAQGMKLKLYSLDPAHPDHGQEHELKWE
jgi:3',5'-cyclic-AMP phosphodiesterase